MRIKKVARQLNFTVFVIIIIIIIVIATFLRLSFSYHNFSFLNNCSQLKSQMFLLESTTWEYLDLEVRSTTQYQTGCQSPSPTPSCYFSLLVFILLVLSISRIFNLSSIWLTQRNALFLSLSRYLCHTHTHTLSLLHFLSLSLKHTIPCSTSLSPSRFYYLPLPYSLSPSPPSSHSLSLYHTLPPSL